MEKIVELDFAEILNFDFVWNAIILAVLTLVVFCHLSPTGVNFLISNAFTTQIQWNFGTDALNFQTVNLFIYHTTKWSRLCHLTLVPDSLAWMFLSLTWNRYAIT